ncbi:metallo-mystery pair system four-Cys motif protein [Zoogloea oleivorans]|uniref:Metallo-mystery pair system four-Cys motif protein n=1 Tax=Zoogloea oleivorans TaxID=1552750 RepID=A0A6C2CXB6_9RHOO|nr:MbnP family copper-binding protein [Zoogloea oleivorans]TYC58481.1 metallo-mystery pair system four-Cys motif protein [Zoogloea oleivorans]
MRHRVPTFALGSLAAALLAACGGGGGGSEAPKTTLSGTVADGYLKGATVCLDVNGNSICDSGEPSGITTDGGKYTLTGITASDETKYPVLVSVPATAIDSDNPTGTVGKSYFLSSPAGKGSFVSPLTTLIQQKVVAGASIDTAESTVKTLLSITDTTVSLFSDYVAAQGTAVQTDATTAGRYARTHEAARVVAASLQAGYDALKSDSNAKAVQKVLLAQAEDALSVQKVTAADTSNPTFSTAGVVAADSPNTLKKILAYEKGNTVAATQTVNIDFDVVAGSQAVSCGVALTGLGTKATSGQVKDLRFYITNVLLIDAQGNTVPVKLDDNANQSRDVALIDFEDATGKCPTSTGTVTTYKSIAGKVAPGTYVGVALTLGVPVKSADADKVSLNHSDTTAATTPPLLTNASMAWSWQSGRKFSKIEFVPDAPITRPTGTTTTWNVHLGSTGCKGDPTKGVVTACTNPNRMDFSFAAFNASTQKIVLDLAELFKNSDLSYDSGGAAGCMSGTTDPECAGIFEALQIGLASGLPINGGAAQKLFAVKAK